MHYHVCRSVKIRSRLSQRAKQDEWRAQSKMPASPFLHSFVGPFFAHHFFIFMECIRFLVKGKFIVNDLLVRAKNVSIAILLPSHLSEREEWKKKNENSKRRKMRNLQEGVVVRLSLSRYPRRWTFGKHLHWLCIEIRVNFVGKYNIFGPRVQTRR